jgi:hypothetical protein
MGVFEVHGEAVQRPVIWVILGGISTAMVFAAEILGRYGGLHQESRKNTTRISPSRFRCISIFKGLNDQPIDVKKFFTG